MPRFFNGTTARFARYQPAQNEYSRYPGHPAQTALSPVFQAFGQQLVVSPALSDTQLATVLQRYHQISPRVPWGGSYGGTKMPSVVLVPDKDDRLYTTLDELVFNRNRGMQDPALTQQDMATARFFLTPHSRAPELNLFNQPRVMLWPISAEPTERNAKDKLLAFVGTGGGKPWYFTRLKNFKTVDDAGTGQKIRGDLDLDSSSVTGAWRGTASSMRTTSSLSPAAPAAAGRRGTSPASEGTLRPSTPCPVATRSSQRWWTSCAGL